MSGKWYPALLVILAVTFCTTAASAQQARSANVGDQVEALLTGLAPVNGAGVGSCPGSSAAIFYEQFFVPPTSGSFTLWNSMGSHDVDNAAFLSYMIGTRIIMLVAFDEQNPSVPAEVYADLDGKGLITNVYPAAQAPLLCEVVQQLHYQP
jgi:hypothetical protein